jgi:hypothetical protein
MSNTSATSARFWKRMHEMYGDRWIASYSPEPSTAWIELLNRYTPGQIGTAIAALTEKPETRQHPPSLPQFEALLITASRATRAEMSEAEWRRGYWRSVIIHHVSSGLGYGFGEFESVLIANKTTLGAGMRHLLDVMDDMEQRTGQRTTGMEEHARRECERIAVSYHDLRKRTISPPVTATEDSTGVPF